MGLSEKGEGKDNALKVKEEENNFLIYDKEENKKIDKMNLEVDPDDYKNEGDDEFLEELDEEED